MLLKHYAVLACFCAVKEITCVKLNTGKIAHNLELSAALFVCYSCNGAELALFTVYAEIVVIASAHNKLLIVSADVSADFLSLSEIKGCSRP